MSLTDYLVRSDTLYNRIAPYLNSIVLSLVVLLSGFILGRIVDKTLQKLSVEFSLDDRCARAFGVKRNYARATRRTARYSIYIITIFFSLRILRIEAYVAVAGIMLLSFIAGVAVLLGMVEFFPNILSRKAFLAQGLLPGVTVEIIGQEGTVRGIVRKTGVVDLCIQRSRDDLLFYPWRSLKTMQVRVLD